MSLRSFAHVYECPGCGKQFDLVTKVEQRRIDREFNPAPYIAREKLETEKKAAAEHAVRGCRRPV
jgi:hypothetical protein